MTSNTEQTIAARIRALRDKFDLRQRALAEITGLSQATISRMENGEIGLPFLLVLLGLAYLENLDSVTPLKRKHAINGQMLQKQRKAMKLSKRRLAKYLGVSNSTVGLWEAGLDVGTTIFVTIAIEQLRIELSQREELREMTADRAANALLEQLLAEAA